MIPGNVDPRRPDKVQRFKAPPSGNGNAPGDDLTPDYMNILGPESTTANAEGENKIPEPVKSAEPVNLTNQQQPQHPQRSEEALKREHEGASAIATNVIPTSAQYGVAIIPASTSELTEGIVTASETLAELIKDSDAKEMHSTPSKNDRFKVVKIASTEPFRRGRWKCMDYLDEVPPVSIQQPKTVTPATTAASIGGGVYMQTQSLPPQHIQQMLMQGGYNAPMPQYFQNNMQSQVMPQAQYYYQGNMATLQGQGLPQQLMNANVLPANYINTNQPWFQPTMVQNSNPSTYQNMQFVQPTLIQNQNSAFTTTGQNMNNPLPANFQPGQSYPGPPAGTQQNTIQGQNFADNVQNVNAAQSQPLVNGYAYPAQNANEQQAIANGLPTQVAKNVVLNSNVSTQVNQNQINQMQNVLQNQARQNQQDAQNIQSQQPVAVANVQNPQFNEQQNSNYQQQNVVQQPQVPQNINQNIVHQNHQSINHLPQNLHHLPQNPSHIPQSLTHLPQNLTQLPQNFNPNMVMTTQGMQANMYANQQFVANVNNLPTELSTSDAQKAETANGGANPAEVASEHVDDPAKTNPVVNAIDNKIEQAMDLVKSHLMYTVREEVEVLKEKIAELMERIQQLETENNYLRSQLPKSTNTNSNGSSEPAPQ